MITHDQLLEQMALHPDTFLYYIISNALEEGEPHPRLEKYYARFDACIPGFHWTTSPYIPPFVDNSEIFRVGDLRRSAQVCTTYVRWAFRAGYLAEAAKAAGALRALDLWDESVTSSTVPTAS